MTPDAELDDDQRKVLGTIEKLLRLAALGTLWRTTVPQRVWG